MSRALLCIGDGTPLPRPTSDVVTAIAVVIVLITVLGSAPAGQGTAYALLAETVAVIVVAALRPPTDNR
ncbi:hypothetical protein ACFVU4_32625 [Streptomyces sp. NPDC058107]|uniref:hypothetical protein n=1 Tax=Streptomyces sp. NPDC058107 TaxID=3346343 RepID=UPI0036E5102F